MSIAVAFTAAMVRLLLFAGGVGQQRERELGRKDLYWYSLTTRSDAARVREAMLHVGIPWLAARLAEEEPVAIVRTRPAISRLDAMRAELSSVIVCLRHPAALANLGAAADLLLERGHAWLGEPLALWLADEREKAVDLLLERVPVLDDYAEWDLEDAFAHADDLARARLAQEPSKNYWFGTWPPRRVPLLTGNPERDDFYSRVFDYQRRLTRASEP